MSRTRFFVLLLLLSWPCWFLGLAGAHDDGAPAKKKDADQQNVINVATPVSGIVLVVGTEIKKGEQPPPGKLVTIQGRQYLPLAVGDRVKAGQMLVQLDDRLATFDMEIKKANLRTAEAKHVAIRALVAEARARLDTARQLFNRGAIAREDFIAAQLTHDKYVEEEKQAAEPVAAPALELERARLLVHMHRIDSPLSGVIRAIRKTRAEGAQALETIIVIEEKTAKN